MPTSTSIFPSASASRNASAAGAAPTSARSTSTSARRCATWPVWRYSAMALAAEPFTADPMVPHLAAIEQVVVLTPDTKMLRLRLLDGAVADAFTYKVGQFALVSVFGVGEAAFDISSLCRPGAPLEFAVRRVGTLTAALHELEEGSVVGIRGPFGNFFP